ncbi:unnamed protein product [Pleuronectes platessa]|uniref:Uncharacterized protein n=1 Tax=Pleuronectes platessa TaxID=8262 RepID=A0A9N7Z474_PLEPL|nr:unnamed protein product [Pleuronectes platessa]
MARKEWRMAVEEEGGLVVVVVVVRQEQEHGSAFTCLRGKTLAGRFESKEEKSPFLPPLPPPPLHLLLGIGFGVRPSPPPYAGRHSSFRTTLSLSLVWSYTLKAMSPDAKHPGKVGRHQTMINTALRHLLEGDRGIIASR